jgi:dihydrofolate synthase / folylpolyglutamate synthase
VNSTRTGPPRYGDLLRRLDSVRSLGVDLGLARVRTVLDRLGNPERAAPAVHVAGTNGKGSVAAMTESILRSAGLRTGLFTSPHLSRFTERIRVDGREVSGDELAALDAAIVQTGVPLTYFEVGTVLGFLAFAQAQVDVMVLETGLGGRLDATSACRPVATAITSIGHDHLEILGPTLADVAREKAGIAKTGIPLFLGPLDAESDRAIAAVATSVGAPLARLGRDFPATTAPTRLGGAHQALNAALAVALARTAIESLRGPRSRPAGDDAEASFQAAVAAGLGNVIWPGRLEWIGSEVLLDCAHNTEGAEALVAALDALPQDRPRALVISIVDGKPAADMLAILASRFDILVATRSSNPRTLPTARVAALTRSATPPPASGGGDAPQVLEIDDALQALAEARRKVGEHGLVVVAGSIFLVGDVRAALLGEARDPVLTSDPAPTAAAQRP